MGSLGPLVGAVWFFMLFLAAVTSSISMYQPVVAFLQETLGVDRRRGVLLMAVLAVIGSFLTIYPPVACDRSSARSAWMNGCGVPFSGDLAHFRDSRIGTATRPNFSFVE